MFSLMDMPPRAWRGLGGAYLLRSTCPMPVAVLNAFGAFSHSPLIAPLAPGQINMIIPMLHMREVRLRKITWPPQATQVVQSEFQARTSSVPKLGSCQCGRVRTPPSVRTPAWVRGRRLALTLLRPGQETRYKEARVNRSHISWLERSQVSPPGGSLGGGRLGPHPPPRAPWEGQAIAL